MDNKKNQIGKFSFQFGYLCTLAGSIFIFADMITKYMFKLFHTVFDVVPADLVMDEDQLLYFNLIWAIGLPSIFLFLVFSSQFYKKGGKLPWGPLAALFFFPTALAVNASLIFGGGWYVGTVVADLGACLLVASMVNIARPVPVALPVKIQKRWNRKAILKVKLVAGAMIAGCGALLAIGPLMARVTSIPDALIPEASAKPQGITPDHANTFYILPIWEASRTNDSIGIAEMQYLVDTVGGDSYTGNGFVRIGRSLSCWYTNDINGSTGEFNPTNLYRALNLSAATNTPVLFHMNGGNWGQHGNPSEITLKPFIYAMRSNISNCQWDQNNVCHPIKYNPGPNDRFWSFWPGSEWEQYRETNIKVALAIIHDWWQDHDELLVGFSTDSEYHLNNHWFEEQGYKSYFDYNPGTIQQYREWAQANWTLAEFNQICNTNFATWAGVDAPRSASVVGNQGHPWWETWTEFRIWHVKEASRRQCQWINESGFPRSMIWNHQIFSEPGDENARYQRCDPLETAVNNYSRVGVTRYDWISPEDWHSLGELALNDGSGDDIPSWGIFEWNLWHQHEYWAYREMLNCIYQYGGHVICPNEWTNCSRNEGLWIPGDDPNDVGDDSECNETNDECCCFDGNCYKRHGNPQFQAALQDFVAKAQDYERGTCPDLRVNKWEVAYYDQLDSNWDYFGRDPGIYVAAGVLLGCVIYAFIMMGQVNKPRWVKRALKRR